MYKKLSVKIYSTLERLAVKRALPLFPVFYFSLLLFTFSFSSCATRRTSTTTQVVIDTTHVTVTDTTHIVSVRDSTVLTEREVIHERIVTVFDPQTGHPIEQTLDRDISRQRDSLVLHLRDSLRHALQLEALIAHADSLRQEAERASGQAAISPAQYAVRLAIVWALLIGMVIFIVYAIRTTVFRR